MSTAVLAPPRGTSAYTYPDQSPYAPAVDASRFSSGAEDASEDAWDQLIDELLRIRLLKDDWDGEGSEAPHPALVHGAIKLAQALKAGRNTPANRVSVSVNGTVYFEWYTPLGYQEIEVTSPLDAESRWVEKGSEVTEVVGITLRP